jgi:predicted nucleotidyltransferase
MEYTLKTEDLKNDLLAETLQALAECYAALPAEVYVVGAAARDLAFRLLKVEPAARRTLDLDVAVMLRDWRQYDQLTELLLQHHFDKLPEKQRFVYRGANNDNKYVVDIVPFGEIAYDEQVAWPPEGTPVMSVRCFEDVMNNADKVMVDNKSGFRLASLAGQFLIKLDTWYDRHLTTHKDATDMVYILQNVYLAYANACTTALPPEINIDAEIFEIVVAGAEWIAAELKQILTDEHRRFYADALAKEIAKEEESELLDQMLDVAGSQNYAVFRRALQRMVQIIKPQ